MNRRSFFGLFALPLFVKLKPETKPRILERDYGIHVAAWNFTGHKISRRDVVRYGCVDNGFGIAVYLVDWGEFVGVASEDIAVSGCGYIQFSGVSEVKAVFKKSRKPKRKKK